MLNLNSNIETTVQKNSHESLKLNDTLSNPIVFKLKQLVASERKITAEIVEHIQMIDQKKIFLEIGYPNLYSFLTEHIGYAPASAQRRIEAARLLTSVPEVKKDIQAGHLNLSQVSLVAQSIRQKQKEEPTVNFTKSDKKSLLDSVKGLSLEKSQKVITQTLDLEIKTFEKQKVQSDESVRLELTLTKEQYEMFIKVKSLMSHVNPAASVADVFDYLAKYYLKRKDPMQDAKGVTKSNDDSLDRVKCDLKRDNTDVKNSDKNSIDKSTYETITNCPRKSGPFINTTTPSTSATEVKKRAINKSVQNLNNKVNLVTRSKSRKVISAAIKRAVWRRDQGMCQHINTSTGKKCGSKHLLEFDHIKRYSHGGDDSIKNLQLLCKSHNLWKG